MEQISAQARETESSEKLRQLTQRAQSLTEASLREALKRYWEFVQVQAPSQRHESQGVRSDDSEGGEE